MTIKNDNISEKQCVSCKRGDVWRICLRECGHFVCIACSLLHLKHWIMVKLKARIKCPKPSCTTRIHENDIESLFDHRNNDLDHFMPLEHREWLLYQHRKHVIYYAFGGMCRQCPLCKSLYGEVEGCHYVQCVNVRCNQYFCWECNEPVDSFQHFAAGSCKVGWDDLWRFAYILRFLIFTEGCILIIIIPCVTAIIMFGIPLFVLLAFPVFVIDAFRKLLRRNGVIPILITFSALLLYPVFFVLGIPLAIGSTAFILPLMVIYTFVAVIKCLPIGRVFNMLGLVETIAACFGLGDWRTILRDTKEARKLKDLEIEQKKLEQSEREGEEEDEEEDNEELEEGPFRKLKQILGSLPFVGKLFFAT